MRGRGPSSRDGGLWGVVLLRHLCEFPVHVRSHHRRRRVKMGLPEATTDVSGVSREGLAIPLFGRSRRGYKTDCVIAGSPTDLENQWQLKRKSSTACWQTTGSRRI